MQIRSENTQTQCTWYKHEEYKLNFNLRMLSAIPFNIYTPLSTTSSEGVEIFYSSHGGQKICISKFLKGFANKAC